MALLVNLRHLEDRNLRLTGEISAEEMQLETRDEAVQAKKPIVFDLEVQQLETSVLAQGRLTTVLDCECVRCLKAFALELKLAPWTCHVELQGEEAAPVINDCVDLTPWVREDILLELPQHPLCKPDCRGMPATYVGRPKIANAASEPEEGSAAWAALNKLKF